MKVESFGLTDIGKVREENQDAFSLDDDNGIYIVADGMGGLEEGALAARFAVQGITELLDKRTESTEEYNKERLMEVLQGSIEEVSNQLRTAVGDSAGSTVVVSLLAQGKVIIANLGDSPAFLFRKGDLQYLTKDQSLAGLMLEMGKITKEKARKHPLRHKLTAYVGMEGKPPVHVTGVALEHGDRLLLCTDGLSGMIGEKVIARILTEKKDVEEAVKKLVSLANEAGGYDNITVVLIDLWKGVS